MRKIPDLIMAFLDLGIGEGDTVLVHSSLRRLGPADGNADGVIDALRGAVRPAGTVAVPTHTWGTVNARQPVFHQALSLSMVGALTNVFRQRPGAVRSLHPTHSVAAMGARAAELVAGHECHETPCARTSPYGRLVDWDGKILFLGVGLECCTFFHACEEWAGCPWLFAPEPELLYSIPDGGQPIPVPSRRHAPGFSRCYPALEGPLRDVGALVTGTLGDCPLRLLDGRLVAEWLVPRLCEDPSLVIDRA